MKLNIGDEVRVHVPSTEHGQPTMQYIGNGRLLRKVGTVENFWQVRMTDGGHFGSMLKAIIHEEDFVSASKLRLA